MQKISDKSGRSAKKILFLGYDKSQTAIIDTLISDGHEVWHTKGRIEDTADFEFVISFGYTHILKGELLRKESCPIINLHISYLPYNRGAHPNFWSFFDGTPSGVTIHLVDEGIDTGSILFQKYVNFEKNERTFAQTHTRLRQEVESLFLDNKSAILSKDFTPIPQRGSGTYHRVNDLPTEFRGWDSDVQSEIERLDAILTSQEKDKLQLIDEIESVRKTNNVNWMDLLRLAFSESPREAKKIIRKINDEDNRISELFKQLGE